MSLSLKVLALVLALNTFGVSAFAAPQVGPKMPKTAYLFSYFKTKTDKDGLYLAWSADGVKWNELNLGQSLLKPTAGEEKRMRDPYVMQGPDGTFHLVFTTGWKGKTIGYSSSKDLIHWSQQKTLNLMGESYPTTLNCWAPKISYDKKNKDFLIYWASAVPGQFPDTDTFFKAENNHRLYSVRTKNFVTFTEPQIFYNPNYITIDGTIEEKDGRYTMFYKGDKPLDGKILKRIYYATADQVGGPYTEQGEALPNDPIEGPSICKVGDAYHLYFDYFTKNQYGVARSTDMKNWTEITDQLAMPVGASHGRVFPVAGKIVKKLIKNDEKQLATLPKPIIDGYTADPAIRVFGDTYYIYPTSDKPNWMTTDFSVWSSKNLIDWKKDGMILDVTKELKWAKIKAWAPDIIERNGTYYFYFCADGKIGVATAKTPTGPFVDALGAPLLVRNGKINTNTIDPYPFIDDDGQAYIYFGNGGSGNVFKLKPDMITLDGDPIDIQMKDFREGIVVFKRNGLYYFMWSVDDARSDNYRVAYGTSKSPLGPVEIPANNLVLQKSGLVKGTGHHSVVNVPGTDRWYAIYHRHAIPGGSGYQRETCIARMEFNSDGTIKVMDPLAPVFPKGSKGEPIINGKGKS